MELSKEDIEEGTCGLLKALYGARDAAQKWEVEYTEILLEMGFVQGTYSACAFCREQKMSG